MVAASAVTKESFLFGVGFAMFQRERRCRLLKGITTRKLVYMSFLISLSIVLTRILSLRIPIFGVEGIRIGFGGLPIIFASVIFGPMTGGIVGAVSDLIGYFINPIGAYMPHFTLTAFLTGFVPGFFIFYVFREKRNYITLLVSIAIGQTISSIILVPYFIHILFGAPLKAILVPRLIGEPINIVIYAYLVKILLNYNLLKPAKEIKVT
jgi:riboflavin transporter